MRLMLLAIMLIIPVLAGCDYLRVNPYGPTEPAEIPLTKFLRPTQDEDTGVWVAAWVEPDGFADEEDGA